MSTSFVGQSSHDPNQRTSPPITMSSTSAALTSSSGRAPQTEERNSSPGKKASPSDVIFGRSPGRDEACQLYESLSSDSAVSSGGGSAGGRAANAQRLEPTSSSTSSLHPVSSSPSVQSQGAGSQAERGNSSSAGSSESSDAPMEVDPARASIHATPSTAASTEISHDLQDLVENVKVLPALFEDCEPDDVVVLVADMLSRLTTHNDLLPLHPSSLTRFHSRAPPSISVLSYLKRIAKYTSLEKSCTLILLVYIDRVCQRNTGFTICSLTVHRFVCAAVVCASKALCDAFSTNGHYARVGGISLIELNMLEKEFLNNIDWKLSCSGALLQHYYTSLVRSHSLFTLESNSSSPVAASTLSHRVTSMTGSDAELVPEQ